MAARHELAAGSVVDVRLDDGKTQRTRTRSEPWQLGHGAWVVLLEGRAGGFLLERCTPVSEAQTALDFGSRS